MFEWRSKKHCIAFSCSRRPFSLFPSRHSKEIDVGKTEVI